MRAEYSELLSHASAFSRTQHRGREHFQIHRLFEHIGRTMLHRFHGDTHIGVAGQQNDADIGIVGAQCVERRHTVRVGESQIEQHDVGRVFCGESARFRGRRRTTSGVAKRFEKLDQR